MWDLKPGRERKKTHKCIQHVPKNIIYQGLEDSWDEEGWMMSAANDEVMYRSTASLSGAEYRTTVVSPRELCPSEDQYRSYCPCDGRPVALMEGLIATVNLGQFWVIRFLGSVLRGG